MRIVRCHDSSINSIVAGGAASYILVSLQSEAIPNNASGCLFDASKSTAYEVASSLA